MTLKNFYRRKQAQWLFLGGGTLAAAGLAFFLWWQFGWSWYWVWMVGINSVALLAYGLDKGAAKWRTKARIPEVVLHLYALLGGFAGAGLGMVLFNHKRNWNKHPLFPLVLSATAVLHILLFWFVIR